MSLAAISDSLTSFATAVEDAARIVGEKTEILTNCLGSIATGVFNAARLIGEKTDVAGRVARVGLAFIRCGEVAAQVLQIDDLMDPFIPLKGRLKIVKETITATNFFERLRDISTPELLQKNFMKSYQSFYGRSCLTIAQGLELWNFIDKYSFKYLEKFSGSLGEYVIFGAKFVGEKVYYIPFVKDIFIIGASGFGIWGAAENLQKDLAARDNLLQKKNQWIENKNNPPNWENYYQEKLRAADAKHGLDSPIRRAGYEDCLGMLSRGSSLATIRKRIDTKSELEQAKIKHATLSVYAKRETDPVTKAQWVRSEAAELEKVKTLSKELAKVDRIKKKCAEFEQKAKAIGANRGDLVIDHKIDKYNIRIANKQVEICKNGLSIAADAFKIAIIVLATACAIMGIAEILPFAILIAIVGLISECLGLAKPIFSDIVKPADEISSFAYN